MRKVPAFDRAPGELIWIHSVSVGETRAAAALAPKLKGRGQIVISTTTETGLEEARRSLPFADLHFLLPRDFPPIMKRLVQRLRPTLFIQVESDFWPSLVHYLRKEGTRIALVNGKMSESSFKRHRLFPPFGKWLFSHYDFLALQSETYLPYFEKLAPKSSQITVTGNLKFDSLTPQEDLFEKEGFTITIGSTHVGEEGPLVEALRGLPGVKILLAPRHPERFDDVSKIIGPHGHYSKGEGGKVILVDAMGLLKKCYASSDLAIVAGSFTPKVGGHNIFEPFEYGVPALFGPYMFNQKTLAEEALAVGAGRQVKIEDIADTVKKLMDDRKALQLMGKRALKLSESARGSVNRTIELLEKNSLC